MIILRDISLRRAEKALLEHTDLTIQPGQKVALIGGNGCGKSSLFALLLGELGADTGHIEGLDPLRLASMAQQVETTDELALEYVIGGDKALAALRAALSAAEAEQNFEAAAQLHIKMDAAQGYDAERNAEKLLLGLGFNGGDGQRSVSEFSGGWQIRLNLGRALMCPSDLLLLDEPTNHLDLDATVWLQQWLQNYKGTLVLISHDREFIDATCQQVIHMERQSLTSYRGNYSSFETQRAERLAQQQANFEKQQRRIGEIDDFIRRFRYKATKAKQAQSRLKELERMQQIAPAHVDSPFNFKFFEPDRASDPVLRLDKATLGYGDLAILENVDLILRPGSRLGLLGRNGAGKSTLLKSVTGKLALIAGERNPGAHCHIGYFDQQQLEALDLDASAALHLQRLRPQAREQDILNFIGGFDFTGDNATKPIRPFSGGEKARLALALTVWQKPNLLILDEPTNHLDMDMRLALTVALQGFEGAMVLVTHDRHLLRNTVDELLLVHNGRVEEYNDDISAYEQWVLRQNFGTDPAPRKNEAINRRQQRQNATLRREKLSPIAKEIYQSEAMMARAEKRLGEIENQLVNTEIYEEPRKDELAELMWEQGRLKREASDMEERWLELQQQLEDLRAS